MDDDKMRWKMFMWCWKSSLVFVSSVKHFHFYNQIIPVTINLSNDITTKATRKENKKLCDTLCLRDVLYIPNFPYNLISISKLVLHNNALVTFTNSHCFIRDSTTHHKIGSVDLHAGLYVLHELVLNIASSIHSTSSQ